ncbi:uncharacterized protein PRCAT00002604001 [Priceomyces carsonii]|uniref:uncharacterized protein n=1 Tax=Priceomyces carsonii TaxID=28549 RepID=UPI002ED7D80B|nr:unnamed protein product [Priceomyces carsonii]
MLSNITGDKLTLHWLDHSRSQRILWLLELLGLNYELETYFRDKNYRAPKELKDVHPSGKSPILVIAPEDGLEEITLAESGNIIQYVVEKYDTKGILTPESDYYKRQVNYFLHYSEGTLQPLLVSLLVNFVARSAAPFGARYLTKLVTKGINDGYYTPELKQNLQYLDDLLQKQGTEYFAGNKITAADIILSFPISENLFSNKDAHDRFGGDLLKYTYLSKWSEKINNDPVYKKITEQMRSKSKKPKETSNL